MVAQECRKLSNGTEWDLLCINGMQRDAVGQRQSPVSYLCTVFRESGKQRKLLYITARNGKQRKSAIPPYRIFAP